MNINIHPTTFIGPNVKVAREAFIGPNCYIDGDVSIATGIKITGNVTLVGKISIGENSTLEPGVFVCSNSSNTGSHSILIGNNVLLGAGSNIYTTVNIGDNAIIEAGTLVNRDVPANSMISGNPAEIKGYVSKSGLPVEQKYLDSSKLPLGVIESSIDGVSLHRFNKIRDLRGDLTIGEFPKDIPFKPKRYFIVYDVPSANTRGEHAHKECHQFLICVTGSVSIVVDDGLKREEVILNKPNMGIYVPPLIWSVQYNYSKGAVLLVFASDYYDQNDYIRNYNEFLSAKGH